MLVLNKQSILVMITMLLTACGAEEHSSAKSNSQVVAKVNGDEISVHQVNMLLARAGNVPEEQKKEISKKIIDKLIAEQLLVQKAVESSLDRDPQVLQAMEASKKKVLAQAYVQKYLLKDIKPSADEMNAFYDEHPELFAERRVFRLQELVVQAGGGQLEAVKALVAGKNNMTEIAQLLKENNYQFSVNANVRAAEQLPGEFLSKLQPLKDGELVVLENGEILNIVKVAASQLKSISQEKAVPVIEKYFENKNRTESMQVQMGKLKSEADIQYLGAFADLQTVNSDAAIESKPVSANDSLEQNDVTTSESTQSNLDIDKGLSGF